MIEILSHIPPIPQPFAEPDPYHIEPHQFLELLFCNVPDGFIEVCYLAPEGMKLYPHTVVAWRPLPLGHVEPGLARVMEFNRDGYGCYFAPVIRNRAYEPEEKINKNGRPYLFYPRGKATDAYWITALWVDVDVAGSEGYEKLASLNPPASVIINSGGGWHGYWLLTEPLKIGDWNRDAIKQTIKGMNIACGGDTKVADLARIMRLPGTVNTKPGRGNVCEIYDHIPAYYHYNELEVQYAPLAAPAQLPIRRAIPVAASVGMPRWVEEYLNTGAPKGERNSRAYAAARALLDNGFSGVEVERMVWSRASADGLDDHEIATLLRSAEMAPRNAPNIDRTIHTGIATDDHLMRYRGA